MEAPQSTEKRSKGVWEVAVMPLTLASLQKAEQIPSLRVVARKRPQPVSERAFRLGRLLVWERLDIRPRLLLLNVEAKMHRLHLQ